MVFFVGVRTVRGVTLVVCQGRGERLGDPLARDLRT
jgi:hypothetical protein